MRLASWKLAARRRPIATAIATALSLLLLGGLGWAALAPIAVASHDARYEIPREFEDLMQQAVAAGALKHPVPYAKYVDESFAHAARPASIAL